MATNAPFNEQPVARAVLPANITRQIWITAEAVASQDCTRDSSPETKMHHSTSAANIKILLFGKILLQTSDEERSRIYAWNASNQDVATCLLRSQSLKVSKSWDLRHLQLFGGAKRRWHLCWSTWVIWLRWHQLDLNA